MYIVRDKNGNVIQESGVPLESDVPTSTNNDQYQEPERQAQQRGIEVPDYTPSGIGEAIGSGLLTGYEEVNEALNPLYSEKWVIPAAAAGVKAGDVLEHDVYGPIAKPIAAGLISAFSPKDYATVRKELDEQETRAPSYSEIRDYMKQQHDARKQFAKETEGDDAWFFTPYRETIEKSGPYIQGAEAVAVGGRALKDLGVKGLAKLASTKKGAAILEALKNMPRLQKALNVGGKVIKGTVASDNPIARGLSWSIPSAGQELYSSRKAGRDWPTSLGLAGLSGLTTFGATAALPKMPALAAYTAGPLVNVGRGYTERKLEGKETTLSDVLSDYLSGGITTALYRDIIKKGLKKGSKDSKAVDRYKAVDKRSTETGLDEITASQYSNDTPALEVPLQSNKNFMKEHRKMNPAKASKFARDSIAPARERVGKDLKARLDRDYPLVQETEKAQRAQTNRIKQNSRMYDDIADTDGSIPVTEVDKVAPRGSTDRFTIDSNYRGPRLENGDYDRKYFNRAREDISKNKLPNHEVVNQKMRVVSSGPKTAQDWATADAMSEKNIETLEAMNKEGTPEFSAKKIKRAIYNNQHNEKGQYFSNKGKPLELEKTGVGDKHALSGDIEKAANQYDYLVDMEQLGNAPLEKAREKLLSKVGAAGIVGSPISSYGATSKLLEAGGTLVGRESLKNVAKVLSKLSLGDLKTLLNVKWGASIPTANIYRSIRQMPKVKKEESK